MNENDLYQKYIIRKTGEYKQEQILSGGFFGWLYNNPRGIKFRPWLMESGFLHKCVEKFADSNLSRHLVPLFAKKVGINLVEITKPLNKYRSLNEFFTRTLKPTVRPIEKNDNKFISPGDGKLLVFETIEKDTILPVKGVRVKLGDLLCNNKMAKEFIGGSAFILRLYLMDYHRIHFPCAGLPEKPIPINGNYLSVSPIKGNNLDFYSTNKRTLTLFASQSFGKMAFIDIGGFLISSIKHSFEAKKPVNKGDEKSLFRFGGSTLVVLFKKNMIEFHKDLIKNSKEGVETYVKLGEAIGEKPE